MLQFFAYAAENNGFKNDMTRLSLLCFLMVSVLLCERQINTLVKERAARGD